MKGLHHPLKAWSSFLIIHIDHSFPFSCEGIRPAVQLVKGQVDTRTIIEVPCEGPHSPVEHTLFDYSC